MAASLRVQPPEAQQGLRYLRCRIAIEMGIIELFGRELSPAGERLVCREPRSGAFYRVERPPEWTSEEEESYLTAMRSELLDEWRDSARAGTARD